MCRDWIGVVSSSSILGPLVHVSSPDWCMNGPFPILRLGPWALCCVWILSSHMSILFVYLVVQLAQKILKQCN